MKAIRLCAIYTFVMLIIATLINIFDVWNNGLLTMLLGWVGGVVASIVGLLDE